MQRRSFISGLAATAGLTQLGLGSAQVPGNARSTNGDIENVIVMIGDGMGFDPIQVTSHAYGDLAMESMTTAAMTKTYPRNGHVTGSAAAGTALATGFDAYNGQVSVRGPEGAEGDQLTSLMTQLEMAQEFDMATGLVTTTRLTHATPAVYSAHVPDRGMEPEIATHYLDTEVDILLGAGEREWSEDHLNRARNLGYDVLSDSSDLESAHDGPLLGLFDDSHLTYSLDRESSHPDLAQMMREAVDRLQENDEGFFMMVEGGRIDHAEHQNDPWTTAAETKDFDDAVRWVLDYVEDRNDTLVIVTSDHETGGMSTGNGSYGDILDGDAIANATASAEAMSHEIADGGDVRGVINSNIDFEGELTDEEVTEINEATEDGGGWGAGTTIAQIVSPYVGVEWPHTSHTGPGQVVLAEGPGVKDAAFDGWKHHHTDLSTTISAILLTGGVREVPESYLEQWEQAVSTRGANGMHDAYIALKYLGPVEDQQSVTAMLDTNNDGLVDLEDILTIYDAETEGPSARIDSVESVTSQFEIEHPTVR